MDNDDDKAELRPSLTCAIPLAGPILPHARQTSLRPRRHPRLTMTLSQEVRTFAPAFRPPAARAQHHQPASPAVRSLFPRAAARVTAHCTVCTTRLSLRPISLPRIPLRIPPVLQGPIPFWLLRDDDPPPCLPYIDQRRNRPTADSHENYTGGRVSEQISHDHIAARGGQKGHARPRPELRPPPSRLVLIGLMSSGLAGPKCLLRVRRQGVACQLSV
ncbi:hypothetical protein B0J12DRAFT_5303 [Macrophomina phaseolina]|uniref:Uncharacterized protein n=1 Tax=Macrophomina phaseolina TaxID=35725 RepID=A0ABQ8GWS8_9PEZI|nr:hypothetical protein B0J12DRAFT_5303 [Macrophomina phaseolina]